MLYQVRQGFITGRGALDAAAGGGARVFTARGQQNVNVGGGLTQNFTITTGTGATFLVVQVVEQNGVTATSLLCGVTSLTKIIDETSAHIAQIWAGAIPSGTSTRTLAFTFAGANFDDLLINVSTVDNIGSTTVKQTAQGGATTININVSANDLLFATAVTATSFATSTENPSPNDRTQTCATNGTIMRSAEWAPIAAGNASFAVTTAFTYICAAAWA